jgi:hypothetical protein
MSEHKTHLIQYIRNPKTRGRRGIAVAVHCDDGIVRLGYTLHRRTDKADAKFAENTAIERARKNRSGPVITVRRTREMVDQTLIELFDRAVRYFRGCKVQAPYTPTLADKDVFADLD